MLPAVPIAVISACVGLEESYAGWSRWAYLLFFLYGVVIATDERFRAALRRDAVPAAALGIALFLAGLPAFLSLSDPFTAMSWPAAGARAVYGAAGWCWLTAILGLLDRRTPRAAGPDAAPRRQFLAYMTTASLPLYVLHQPILVAVAFQVVRWDAPIVTKYAVIVAVSLVATVAAYDLLVRRTRATRFLFGMRP